MRREVEKTVTSKDEVFDVLNWARDMICRGLPGGDVVVRLGRKRRTLDQNAKLWPMLQDIASQVEWQGVPLSREEWKDLFTGSMSGQKPLMGIAMNGQQPGVVMVGGRTSQMDIKTFCELIEFMYSFGSDHGVRWSEKSEQLAQEHRKKYAKIQEQNES